MNPSTTHFTPTLKQRRKVMCIIYGVYCKLWMHLLDLKLAYCAHFKIIWHCQYSHPLRGDNTGWEHGNAFHIAGPSWGESAGHRWIPLKGPVRQKLDAFFVVCPLNKALKLMVIWDPTALISCHCNDFTVIIIMSVLECIQRLMKKM